MIEPITVDQIKYIAHRLAIDTMEWNEPIPEFETRFPNVLESCLATPFQTYGGKLLYTGLVEKASILFYLLIKNHPFQNGNKRIAVTTLLVFLYFNKKWLDIDQHALYKDAVWIAQSPPEAKDQMIMYIRKMISKNLVQAKTATS